MTMFEMEREEIVLALTKLSAEIVSAKDVNVRLVGGAAMTLHGFDRGLTYDIDAVRFPNDHAEGLSAAAATIAANEDWPVKWFNFDVSRADALPSLGRLVDWTPFQRIGSLVIELADLPSLLAMKLRAGRPGRDTRDIQLLVEACEIDEVHDVLNLFAEFYPGDEPSARTLRFVEEVIKLRDDVENRALDEAMRELGPNVLLEKAFEKFQ